MGIGIDIVENKRFEEIIKNKRKYEKILSEKEIHIFENLSLEKRKIEYIASRFACKEALFKSVNKSIPMNKISILNDEAGKPYIECNELDSLNLEISLSHEKDYSVAVVLNV